MLAGGLCVFGSLDGCNSRPGMSPTVTVTDQDNGGIVHVPVGELLVVSLASNATTGYSWSLVTDDSRVLPSVGKPTYESPHSQLAGAGGEEVFKFKAAEIGKTMLELHYQRPWEKNTPPATVYRLTVEIVPVGGRDLSR
jgi:inhibitor of cysteine peptidase